MYNEFNHESSDDGLYLGEVPASHNPSQLARMVPSYFRFLRFWYGAVNHSPNYALPRDAQAFGDDLKIGRVVWARLKGVAVDYDKADVRPILVTGIWKRDGVIEKIEGLRYASNTATKNYPDRLRINTEQLIDDMCSTKGGVLKLADSFVLDNTESIFPSFANDKELNINPSRWPQVLAGRVFGIVYNNQRESCGYDTKAMEGLTREGFFFPTIPLHSLRNNAFVGEVMAKGDASDCLPQPLVDMIVDYAVQYSENQKKRYGDQFFEFPTLDAWKTMDVAVQFPNWHAMTAFKQNPALELIL